LPGYDDERPGILVHFILDRLTTQRYLDNDINVLGRILADGDGIDAHDSVPGMSAWVGDAFYRELLFLLSSPTEAERIYVAWFGPKEDQ
jgi:hypothetical protein